MTNDLSPCLQQTDRVFVMHKGRQLVYFGGCDYFRLASHPAVLAALTSGSRRFGLNVAASRKTTGNHTAYEALEAVLARFFDSESALALPTGYVTNLAVAQALQGQLACAFIDAQAHGSLVDAAQFLDCPVLTFAHRNPDDLAHQIRRHRPQPPKRILVMTDGVFSHSGAIAPLKAYAEVLPSRALLLVDDAHGAGILGQHGRGTVEHEGLNRRSVIQTVTLSKAFGVYGGAILSSRKLRNHCVTRSRLFAGSTPLPLPLVTAARASLQIVTENPTLRKRLHRRIGALRDRLREGGFLLPNFDTPILALSPRSKSDAAHLQRALLTAGVFPSFINYHAGPAGGFFRFALSSEHSVEQLDRLSQVLIDNQARLTPLA